MGYQRAQWKSGLTYEHECEQCHTVIRYTDECLDFRPWFPNGFVYCPNCKKPLRHDENLAINAKPTPAVDLNTYTEVFCSSCGHRYGEHDAFCSECGRKRK